MVIVVVYSVFVWYIDFTIMIMICTVLYIVVLYDIIWYCGRVHICRNRCNRRLRKIFVDCVNFSVNNANCEQNLSHILRTYCDHISDIGKEALIHWNGPPIAKAQKLGEAALDRVFGGRNRSPLEPSTSCFTLTYTSQVELCHKSK